MPNIRAKQGPFIWNWQIMWLKRTITLQGFFKRLFRAAESSHWGTSMFISKSTAFFIWWTVRPALICYRALLLLPFPVAVSCISTGILKYILPCNFAFVMSCSIPQFKVLELSWRFFKPCLCYSPPPALVRFVLASLYVIIYDALIITFWQKPAFWVIHCLRELHMPE